MQAYACGRLEKLASVQRHILPPERFDAGVWGGGQGVGHSLIYLPVAVCCKSGQTALASQNDAKIESVKFMENVQQLTRCPKCGKRLYVCGHIQICSTCGYWTLKGTARMDSIVVI